MSGIDTIFESARVCAQTPNHLEDCPATRLAHMPIFHGTTAPLSVGSAVQNCANIKRKATLPVLPPRMDQRQKGSLRPGS